MPTPTATSIVASSNSGSVADPVAGMVGVPVGVPFVVLLVGTGLVVYIVRTWKNRPAPAMAMGVLPAKGAELEKFREQARSETEL